LSFESPFKMQSVLGAFPGTHLFLVPFPSTTLTYLWRKEGRKVGCFVFHFWYCWRALNE
jgi:hypothetical protein